MSAPAAPVIRVALSKVEQELSQRLKEAQGAGDAPVIKARMSNLVVFCSNSEQAERVSAEIPAIVAVHPARVIILAPDCPADASDIVASLRVQSHRLGQTNVCSEEIFLHARERSLDSLPFAVRSCVFPVFPWAKRKNSTTTRSRIAPSSSWRFPP